MEPKSQQLAVDEELVCTKPMHPPTYKPTGRPKNYNLPGIQVEDEAGYWTEGPNPQIHVVAVEDVLAITQPKSEYEIKPFPTKTSELDAEIAALKQLEMDRDKPLTNISQFINTSPPPFGAVYNLKRPFPPVTNVNRWQDKRNDAHIVTTGRELARMFEAETPGLLHRHALNMLLFKRPDLSPIRQARIWMALDITIYSALIAAWHYKWAMGPDFSYRLRPYEYDQNASFRVLYDDAVCDDGTFNKCGRYLKPLVAGPKPDGLPSPGTPRHPAYPSGHSTYSAAASAILAYFFPDETKELQTLANNIGEARLWAGVHWRSDHDAGQTLGKAVASLVQKQLEKDCIPKAGDAKPVPKPDDESVVRKRAMARRTLKDCGCKPGTCEHDKVPPRMVKDDCGRDGIDQNFVF